MLSSSFIALHGSTQSATFPLNCLFSKHEIDDSTNYSIWTAAVSCHNPSPSPIPKSKFKVQSPSQEFKSKVESQNSKLLRLGLRVTLFVTCFHYN